MNVLSSMLNFVASKLSSHETRLANVEDNLSGKVIYRIAVNETPIPMNAASNLNKVYDVSYPGYKPVSISYYISGAGWDVVKIIYIYLDTSSSKVRAVITNYNTSSFPGLTLTISVAYVKDDLA
jgi:hypothetical protein